MPSKQHLKRTLFYFVSLYALFYMSNAVYGTFLPIYLEDAGYNKSAIGSLLALGPFVSLLAQPFWGMTGDRAKTKNSVLITLIVGAAISGLLFLVSSNFYFLVFIIAIQTFFSTSIAPLSDAITLEYIDGTKWRYSIIRMSGTIGYALMSIAAGYFAEKDINLIFVVYFVIYIFVFAAALVIPKVKGHQSGGNKVSFLELFKDYDLVVMLAYVTILQMTLGFFYSFFGIYLMEMGGNNKMLGWALFVGSICEVPFLLFADKIIEKLGIKRTIIVSGLVAGLRWLAFYYVKNPIWVLPIQILHGLSFIVLSYTMVTYINKNVPMELKASGQTLFNFFGMGVSRIIASLLGGFLSDAVGIRQVFLYSAILVFASTIIYPILTDNRFKSKVLQKKP